MKFTYCLDKISESGGGVPPTDPSPGGRHAAVVRHCSLRTHGAGNLLVNPHMKPTTLMVVVALILSFSSALRAWMLGRWLSPITAKASHWLSDQNVRYDVDDLLT